MTQTRTKLLFEQHGLYIETVTSGEEAMSIIEKGMAQRRDFDLVLIDVHLPGMSGYALSSWYKDACRNAGRPCGHLVAITADPHDQICREFEFDHCLPKPISSAATLDLIQQVVRARPSGTASTCPSGTE